MEAIIQVQYGAKEEEKMEPKNLNYAPRGKIEYYYYAFMLYWIIFRDLAVFFFSGAAVAAGWLHRCGSSFRRARAFPSGKTAKID